MGNNCREYIYIIIIVVGGDEAVAGASRELIDAAMMWSSWLCILTIIIITLDLLRLRCSKFQKIETVIL